MKWERTGEAVRMVTRESAIHSMANRKMCHEIPIDADHSTMVKFGSRSDQSYQIIRKCILKLTETAPQVIESRFSATGIYSRIIVWHLATQKLMRQTPACNPALNNIHWTNV